MPILPLIHFYKENKNSQMIIVLAVGGGDSAFSRLR